jgi:hypothetical protein
MSGIASVVEELIVAAVFSEKASMPRKNKTDWALTALSVLLAGAGILFLILALDRYLEDIYTPVLAALACTGCLFTATVILTFIVHCLRTKRMVRMNSTRHPLAENLHAILEAACIELEDPIKENPKTAVLAAALAGFLATNHQMRL